MQKLVWLVAGIFIGVSGNTLVGSVSAEESEQPAYLIASGSYREGAELDAYYEAAIPVAEKSGLEILARSEQISHDAVLEGIWAHEGFVVVERFPSMAALKEFWYSDEYQAAIELREGQTKMHFVVAVEGVQPVDQSSNGR